MDINTYAGAGVILLEYYFFNNKYELTVILIHNKRKKLYECPGGKIDKGDSIFKTAAKELSEETANLFKFPKYIFNINNSVDISSGKRLYKTFILNIAGPINKYNKNIIDLNFYYLNKKIIDKNNNIPYCWNETDIITRMSIKEFFNSLKLKNEEFINTKDINNNNIIISRRDKECIIKAFDNGFISLFNDDYITNIPLYKLRFNNSFNPNSKYSFLKDTKYYY